MSKIIENLRYAKTHEWMELVNDTTVRIGISDFAQQALGDLVFINLPEVGDTVTVGEPLGDMESVKAVSDIISPVTGTISGVNQEVLDQPALINESPYQSWFVEVADFSETADLLTAAEYEEFCKEEAH